MKVISVDFNNLAYKGGIASFNKNLKNIFKDKISFITFFRTNNLQSREENFGLPKRLFKIINALSRYYISSLLLYYTLSKVENKDSCILILNSPSFFKLIPKGFNKVILVQHQDSHTMWINRSGFNKSKSLLKKCIGCVHKIVVLSELDKLKFCGDFSIHHDMVVVIPHIVNLDVLNCDKLRTKKLVMVSRLDNNQKRLDLAILAMRSLPDWELNIYGNGADFNFISNLISENKLVNVFLRGETDDVCSALDDNAIHLMTSDFEGFGISNIEALARGLPLIIRDTFPASRTIIKDGNGVLLSRDWNEVEFISAVNLIYSNYDSFSSCAIRTSVFYSRDRISNMWLSFLDI